MNLNPILQKEIGTRRDNQYKVAEKELLKLIKNKKLIGKFDPNISNIYSALKRNNINMKYVLN